MSGSDAGLMPAASRESMPFTMTLHQQNQPPSQSQNMQLSFSGDGTALYKPMSSAPSPSQHQPNSAGDAAAAANPPLNMNVPVTGSEQRVKKKRGRPRKYGPDNDGTSLALVPGAPSFVVNLPTASPGGGGGGVTPPGVKRMRGRPAGSSNKQKLQALGSTGVGFTPHVLTVGAGEDISSKILAFSQNGPRAVCVMSANGAISNVTLRQAAISGGTVTYEGRFEILSLSGSFLLLENNGHRSRSGGLSVTLSAPDGNVLGGSVAGLLIAASPVQIVVGSFVPDGQKEPRHQELSSPALPRVAPTQVLMSPSSPQTRGTMSESSYGVGHGSPRHQNTGGGSYSNTNLSMPWK